MLTALSKWEMASSRRPQSDSLKQDGLKQRRASIQHPKLESQADDINQMGYGLKQTAWSRWAMASSRWPQADGLKQISKGLTQSAWSKLPQADGRWPTNDDASEDIEFGDEDVEFGNDNEFVPYAPVSP